MLTSEQDRKERRIYLLMLILCPISFLIIAVPAFMGISPGIEAGHDAIYLEATCFSWAIVSVILPILRLARIVSLPSFFVAIVYANMYFYVISLNIGLYLNVSWWGDMGHVISSMIVTSIVFIALCIVQYHSPAHVTFGNRKGLVATLFLVALSFGGIWEMIEGFADFAGGDAYMVYGASDTMGDLIADLIGVIAVSTIVFLMMKNRTAEDIAAMTRFGRPSFEVCENEGEA